MGGRHLVVPISERTGAPRPLIAHSKTGSPWRCHPACARLVQRRASEQEDLSPRCEERYLFATTATPIEITFNPRVRRWIARRGERREVSSEALLFFREQHVPFNFAGNAAAGPFSSQPLGPRPVGCFSALLAPHVSIQICSSLTP